MKTYMIRDKNDLTIHGIFWCNPVDLFWTLDEMGVTEGMEYTILTKPGGLFASGEGCTVRQTSDSPEEDLLTDAEWGPLSFDTLSEALWEQVHIQAGAKWHPCPEFSMGED